MDHELSIEPLLMLIAFEKGQVLRIYKGCHFPDQLYDIYRDLILVYYASGIDKMTEKSPASSVHSTEQPSSGSFESATVAESHAFVADRSAWDEQPQQQQPQQQQTSQAVNSAATECNKPPPVCTQTSSADDAASSESELDRHRVTAAMTKAVSVRI